LFLVKSICAMPALEGNFEAGSIVSGKNCSMIVLNIKYAAFKGWKDTMAIKCLTICDVLDQKKASG